MSGPTAHDTRTTDTPLERYLHFVATSEAGDAADRAARTVGDVMTRGVVSAYPGAAAKEIARALSRNRIHAVPVLDEDRHVVGVVSTSDLLAKVAEEARTVPRGHRLAAHGEARRKQSAATAAELMTAPAITTTPDTPIMTAALLAARARVRSLPVVSDADGRLVGMVSREDLIRLFLRDDEDIRAEVLQHVVRADEVPEHGNVLVEVHDGVVTLRGSVETALQANRLRTDTAAVAGVVAVRNELRFSVDDRLGTASIFRG